jgi:hypothetical protein
MADNRGASRVAYAGIVVFAAISLSVIFHGFPGRIGVKITPTSVEVEIDGTHQEYQELPAQAEEPTHCQEKLPAQIDKQQNVNRPGTNVKSLPRKVRQTKRK